jgi:hypothetical protein
MTEGYINTTVVNRYIHPLFGEAKPAATETTPTPIYDELWWQVRESVVVSEAREASRGQRNWRPADLVLGMPNPNDAISGVIVNRT